MPDIQDSVNKADFLKKLDSKIEELQEKGSVGALHFFNTLKNSLEKENRNEFSWREMEYRIQQTSNSVGAIVAPEGTHVRNTASDIFDALNGKNQLSQVESVQPAKGVSIGNSLV